MATAETGAEPEILPGHLDLPEEDGTFVKNHREHPQSILLTEAILPILRARHPDGMFALGQDSGIYWRITDPPLRGAAAPDWFYVPNVPGTLDGHYRRSYVLWKELIPPRIILEFASEDGAEERDATPWKGKFWIYEQVIRPAFYGIFVVETGELQVFHFVEDRFAPVPPDEHGHYPIPLLGVSLGVWDGYYLNEDAPWLRWYDGQGRLLPIDAERADEESRRADEESRRADEEARRADEEARRADEESRRADEESRRADALAARLRALGIDPDEVAGPL